MDATEVTLRPNRGLLDPTFESYKLSLQQCPIYHSPLQCKIDLVSVAENEFSYNRTKVISLHNCLFGDPWCESECYFVDDAGHIRCISVVVDTTISHPASVFQLDPHFLQSERHTPVTISFPSANRCLISDGAGMIYLINTGTRTLTDVKQNSKWERIFMENIAGDGSSPPLLMHSIQHTLAGVKQDGEEKQENEALEILTLRFEDETKENATTTLAFVEWVTMESPSDDDDYSKLQVKVHRTFKGEKAPFYGSLGNSGSDMFLGSHSEYKFVPNWDQQLDIEDIDLDSTAVNVNGTTEEDEGTKFKYEWKQSAEDVFIVARLPEGADKHAVIYNLEKARINVGIKTEEGDTNTVLNGDLFAAVDPEASSWEIANQTLEITLQKSSENETWPCVVIGDMNGKLLLEEVTDASEMDTRGEQPIGIDQYEECDDLPDVDSILYRFDSAQNKFTHVASVASNQWLFNCYQHQKLCTVLRHDVDALVWESNSPDELNTNPWNHVATYNALGYVSASKKDLKYAGCAPNSSYAALCETNRRVYIYHCPTATVAPLRNRVTGRSLHVSKQQVVTLPSTDSFVGFHVTNERIFILTDTQLFVVKVSAET